MKAALAAAAAVAVAATSCARVEVWRFETRVEGAGSRLAVAAALPPGAEIRLSTDSAVAAFVETPQVRRGEGDWQVARRDANGDWLVPSSHEERLLRYGFDLEGAARALEDPWRALRRDSAYLAPPSTWLLRPSSPPRRGEVSLRVVTPASETPTFTSGLSSPGAPQGPYRFPIGYLERLPLAVIGPHRSTTLECGEGEIVLVFLPERRAADADRLERWILSRARALREYLGGFPVPHALLVVTSHRHESNALGITQGNGGASILLPRSARTRSASLQTDWVLLHELLHLAFPQLPASERWIAEGMPTYVAPLLQARAGWIGEREVWRLFLSHFPATLDQGRPTPAEPHLAGAPVSSYWRGALLFFLADLELRRRSHGATTLGDALRGIIAAGGTIEEIWTRDRLVKVADRATGDTVFRELLSRGPAPVHAGLDALWRDLGVSLEDGAVVFDDSAPLAALRAALTVGAPGPPRES